MPYCRPNASCDAPLGHCRAAELDLRAAPERSRKTFSMPDIPTDDVRTVSELRRIVQEFVDQRDWRTFHNAKNLSMALAIEAAELMEHFQWLTTEQVVAADGYDRSQVTEELADVVSYALALANALDIDLSTAVANKMVKNRLKYPPPPT